MPKEWDLGVPGGLGVKNLIFPKFNQIWCVSYSHEWHIQWHIFLVSIPLGLGEGPKGQISLNLNDSQFQRFLNRTLCVFSKMNHIKHIRMDFHSVACVIPRGPNTIRFLGERGDLRWCTIKCVLVSEAVRSESTLFAIPTFHLHISIGRQIE